MNRRDILRLGGTALAGWAPLDAQSRRAPKKVIVLGAGIAGLSCAYELMKRGHEVTVLEANGRTGGHVKTLSDPFADGLYADVGAEHFNIPEYILYRRYVEEFRFTTIPLRMRENRVRYMKGERFTEEDFRRPAVLQKLGFNQRETDFIAKRSWQELPLLYLNRYAEKITDESDPYAGGLRPLDEMSVKDLLKRDEASAAALEFFGGSGSALQSVWGAALKKLRHADFDNKKLFRIKGGNQLMTDTLARRLGERVRLGCPVVGIEHGPSSVAISYRELGQVRKLDADYAVNAISLVALRQIPVTPAWPEAKAFVIKEMPYTVKARLVFQSRTRFWQAEGISPNWNLSDPNLTELWSMADEVKTPRGILIGNGQPGVSAAASIGAFMKHYPGKSADIEHGIVHDWAKDPWAGMCERGTYRPGQLTRFWPEATRPCGRIHFAGAYAAPMSWGQEAALESANRVAQEIDRE